jgi:lipopolysaccharide export system permease protein
MRVLSRYIGRSLLVGTLFIAGVLSAVIMLTQSLRFLELVISSGASGGMFFTLTILVLPRFLEIIIPLSFATAILFIYQKMTLDSELIVMKATGSSPTELAHPALRQGLIGLVLIFLIAGWGTPIALQQMQSIRNVLRSEVSAALLRDGVFNAVGDGLMVYIREKASNGEFKGIVIHDTRDKAVGPVTIFAKRGVVVSTDEGFQVLVYEGARQALEADGKTLQRLHFSRYMIDLPDEKDTGPARWQEPEERTLYELLTENVDDASDGRAKRARQLEIEVHKRFTTPFMMLTFPLIALVAMLTGPFSRRGQPMRVVAAMVAIMVIEAGYLFAFNLSKTSNLGLVLLYVIPILPLLVAFLWLRLLDKGHLSPTPLTPAQLAAAGGT